MRRTVLALLVLVALAGCGDGSVSPAPVQPSPEDAFVQEVLAAPGATGLQRAELTTAGRNACTSIGTPGVTEATAAASLDRQLDAAVGSVVIDAAGRLLCPERQFAAPPAPTTPAYAANGYDTPVADLPAAPPLETWLIKGSDFQQTLDLNMGTALISNLRVAPPAADVEAAQALAFHVCDGLRADPSQSPAALVQQAYPRATNIDAISASLAAQAYCLDTYGG